MTQPQRIKIKSLTKPPEYINREWGAVIGQRHHLLSTTDWTQLEDNELTFESRVRWNEWRKEVRAIRRSAYEDRMDEAAVKLKYLEENLPEREFIQSTNIRQKKYQLDLSNLTVAKTDALNIMKTLHNEWTISFLPENINLINAKYEEAHRYLMMKPKPKSFAEFPLLQRTYKLYKRNRSQTVEDVCRLKLTAIEILLMIEDHQYKFSKQIEQASHVDEIIAIVKNMHGY